MLTNPSGLVNIMAMESTARYILLQTKTGLCLGITPKGRIDLVRFENACRYDTLKAAKSAQKVFGPDLTIEVANAS